MSTFDDLVSAALANRPDLAGLRPVVEKELLHHDILRELNDGALLEPLTFMGGTCLRLCYGSPRLSEDLDFTGTIDDQTAADQLKRLGRILTTRLGTKYGLPVEVSDPVRDSSNVRTWKVRITTRPDRPDLPRQRINIDLQTLPAHDPQPMMLRNPYRVDLGTSGLILNAASLQEILADKLVALALRRNRVKHRDLWDIAWLVQQDVSLTGTLVQGKLKDRGVNPGEFLRLYRERSQSLETAYPEFLFEIRRFLPQETVTTNLERPAYWNYLTNLIKSLGERLS